MSENYGSCGRCGKPMPMPSHWVPPVTWNGRPVCGRCAEELTSEKPEYDRDTNSHEVRRARGAM